MCCLDVVVGEVSEQRTLEIPLCVGRQVGRDVSKFSGDAAAQRQVFLLPVKHGVQELEVNKQSFLILHNLRLLGRHPHIAGIAEAFVTDE